MITSNLFEQIRFIPLWGANRADLKMKAIGLWKTHRVLLREDVMDQRANEIILMAFRGEEPIAVSTASRHQVKLLNNNFFYEYRCFIDPDARIPAFDARFSRMSFDILEDWAKLNDSEAKGIITILENETMKKEKFWRKAVWPLLDMVFVGYNSKRDPIRVSYFKGATI